MNPLEQLQLPAGPGVLDLLPRLAAALQGDSPILPLAPGAPKVAFPLVPYPRELALVVSTSGSTGSAKHAMLTAGNLRASASATLDRLHGPGSWLLALAPHHIAGIQVLVRGIVAGTTPEVLDLTVPFTADAFCAAAERLRHRDGPYYTSLVPTQLARLMQDRAGRESLTWFDAVLVGGAALPAPLARAAQEAGATLVTTYGMSETAGGCVYDGRPLDQVQVRLDTGERDAAGQIDPATGIPDAGEGTGRIWLGGPMVAAGYLGDRERTLASFADQDGTRWFRTDDLGRWVGPAGPDGPRLQVVGRTDDIVNTGGLKIAPAVVEAAVLAYLPQVGDCVIVGTPDDEYGEAVSLAIVLRPELTSQVPRPTLAHVRDSLRDHLPAAALPRRLAIVDALPRVSIGKVDRAALRGLWTRRTQE